MAEPEAVVPANRCGYVAVVGAPNAGKSTLTNRLVGAKVSIVTPKVQTTRARITAIAIEGTTQIVFLDTPGIFRTAKRRLERAMLQAAWSGAEDADLVLLLVDARRGLDDDTQAILEGLARERRPAVLALNKIDLVKPPPLLALSAALNEAGSFAETFMISALNGDGVDDLKCHLAAAMPEGHWLYPEDQLADISERLLASEITREQLFLKLHDELPYALTVTTEGWQERKDGSVRIEQVIYVARDTYKGIVIGKGGQMLKRIGAEARAELGRVLGRTVHLSLFVKVRAGWADDPERYREMGLDYPR